MKTVQHNAMSVKPNFGECHEEKQVKKEETELLHDP